MNEYVNMRLHKSTRDKIENLKIIKREPFEKVLQRLMATADKGKMAELAKAEISERITKT